MIKYEIYIDRLWKTCSDEKELKRAMKELKDDCQPYYVRIKKIIEEEIFLGYVEDYQEETL